MNQNSKYEENINAAIHDLKQEFKFVYHIMHPFDLNLDGPDGLYNNSIEDSWFDYKIKDLLLRHFGTLQGIIDESTVDFSAFITGMFDDSLKLSDVDKWWLFKKDGVEITKESHPDFITELYDLGKRHFKENENQTYYHEDDEFNNVFWNWRPMSWQDLCKKYAIDYDNSLRLSRINAWFDQNGYPKNIRFAKEFLNPDLKLKIEQEAHRLGANIKIDGNHDKYATLLGSTLDFNKSLKRLKCEFFVV